MPTVWSALAAWKLLLVSPPRPVALAALTLRVLMAVLAKAEDAIRLLLTDKLVAVSGLPSAKIWPLKISAETVASSVFCELPTAEPMLSALETFSVPALVALLPKALAVTALRLSDKVLVPRASSPTRNLMVAVSLSNALPVVAFTSPLKLWALTRLASA